MGRLAGDRDVRPTSFYDESLPATAAVDNACDGALVAYDTWHPMLGRRLCGRDREMSVRGADAGRTHVHGSSSSSFRVVAKHSEP